MKVNKKNVVRELVNRNPEALEFVMNSYTERVYGLIHRVIKDMGTKEDIEECVSDTFVEVWENISKYNGQKGSLDTWIFVLAKYKALDFRRKHYTELETQPLMYNPIVSKDDTEEEVIVKEQKQEIANMIDSLSKVDREIFYKRYYFYESIDSIANYYGITKGAVYKRLWRSKGKLMGALQKGEV